MSNFKIYDPGSNTSIDVADLFVRRSSIASLQKSSDAGSELWIFGKSNTDGLAGAPRRLSAIGNWALTQSGWSEAYQYGLMNGVDLIPRNDGTLFAHGLAGLSTIGPSLTETKYQNGALYTEPTVVGPTAPSGIANYNNSFIFGASSTLNGAYYLVRDYSTGVPVVKMYSGGYTRWLGVGYSPSSGYDAPYRPPTLTASPSSSNWKSIATSSYSGYVTTASILEDGTLWTWGPNDYGQLGRGFPGDDSGSLPGQINGGGTTWRDVSIGGNHMVGIKLDGTLWGWGWNALGQLGENTATNKISPVQTVSAGSVWRQAACGYAHTMAIKTDGTLWGWGFNLRGQLGDNSTTIRSSPVQVITGGTNWKQVACGSVFTAAVKSDGTLWTWGYNGDGQLGTGISGVDRSSPIQVGGAYGAMWSQVQARTNGFYAVNYPEVSAPITIATGGNVIATFGGYKYHAFTSSGTFNVTQIAAGGTNIEAVIVGGGGGGGAKRGGGGGAGGFSYITSAVTTTSYAVTIGAGGAGAPGQTSFGSAGGTSSLGALGSSGGGGGSGGWSGTAGSGIAPNGSGGGGGEVGPGGGGGTQPGTGVGTGQAGGAKVSLGGSGGGGASSIGFTGPGGAGGLGNSSFSAWGTVTGTTTVYSTGGKGGDAYGGTSGPAGTPNTGNGGEGADDNSGFVGGAGGSGIVVIRYPFAG